MGALSKRAPSKWIFRQDVSTLAKTSNQPGTQANSQAPTEWLYQSALDPVWGRKRFEERKEMGKRKEKRTRTQQF